VSRALPISWKRPHSSSRGDCEPHIETVPDCVQVERITVLLLEPARYVVGIDVDMYRPSSPVGPLPGDGEARGCVAPSSS
jgi:hypothetical protein